jgi:UDP-glucose 4-epimerase
MRAIVTGSAGFIGSHLCDLLADEGWSVIRIDRRTGPPIEDYPYLPDYNVDAIFHLASPVGPLGVLEQAGTIVPQVVETTRIVADWTSHADCPLIYVSTSEVYGSGHADTETDVCTFGADSSARKEYAVAKLAAETMLRNSPWLDARIVRPFNVAGPGQKSEGGFVLPRFIEQALAGKPLTVYQPGTQRRAFAHVRDIARGILATYHHGRYREVYNLGNPDNECTIERLAQEVITATGSSSEVVIVDPVALHGRTFREAPDKIPNIDKARRELLWEPVIDRWHVIADAIAG